MEWPVEKQQLRLCVKMSWHPTLYMHTRRLHKGKPSAFCSGNQCVKGTAKCFAIVHNAAWYAAGSLHFDAENAAVKIYSHFSLSASQTAQLKEFYEFAEEEK